MNLISKIWWVTKHWLPNFWNKNQNGNNLCKINLVGWNNIWDEIQFGMLKNYSHFLWIWRVLHIFPTPCYGSGCELPKCLNYFYAKLNPYLFICAKFTFWILLFFAWILDKRNNASGRFWMSYPTHISHWRNSNNSLLKLDVWFGFNFNNLSTDIILLLPLVKLPRIIISSKILCLIQCEARLKVKEFIFNGIKLLPLVNLSR